MIIFNNFILNLVTLYTYVHNVYTGKDCFLIFSSKNITNFNYNGTNTWDAK